MAPSLSVIIPTRNQWELTRACLEALRPTLSLRAEVIVVDLGSTDETLQGLRRYSWVQVVSHDDNPGTPRALNSGAAVATGELLVFLDNGALVTSRWLDGLLAPFAEAGVAATGPCSNVASGVQRLDAGPYAPTRMAEVQRLARAWREERRGQTTQVPQLDPFCLAVRRTAFDASGGFDEHAALDRHVQELCMRLTRANHRLVVSHSSFVHRGELAQYVDPSSDPVSEQRQRERRTGATGNPAALGNSPGVLLSACLIVRDEEDNLRTCLDSLEGLVDEVVVYDTGSTDRTVEIAREAGATVLEGFWDDDFGRARNASLAACRGRWVLHVDADEVVLGDHAALRKELSATRTDALHVDVENVNDAGDVGFSHNATRLFQRLRAHWHGRLHEQVVTRSGQPLSAGKTTRLRIRHFGYQNEIIEQRQKHDRNVRVARAGADASGGSDALALINLGRALGGAGKLQEALEQFTRARELTTDSALLRQALRTGAEALMESGRSGEALDWIRQLREHSRSSTMADYLEGMAKLNLLDTAGALTCFERIDEARDEDFTVSDHVLRLRRGLVLAASERWDEAATDLLEGVRGRKQTEPVWAPLVEAHWRASRAMHPVAELVDDDNLLTILGQVLNTSPLAGDALVELLWQRLPEDRRLLAFAVNFAHRLPVPRVLEWAARVRTSGLPAQCPLVRLAGEIDAPPLDRVRATAIALEAFADDRGRADLPSAARLLPASEFATALLVVDELSPQLLPALVLGVAVTPSRTAAMAEVLRSVGADEQADALVGLAVG